MGSRLVSPSRQYDLDWIRVLATFGVFLYHCSMFFNPFPWHVKNSVLDSGGVLIFSLFVGAWIMPIFFAVSGMNVSHALNRRKSTEFIRERFIRLGIPLVFGVFILTPPQVYMERVAGGQFDGSFFAFFPHYFDGIYLDIGGTGNFAFFGLHLWYLLVLLVFSLLALPLFKFVPRGNSIGFIHFWFMPIALFAVGFVHTQNLGGWDLIFYLLIFIYGYYFFSSPTFKPFVKSTIKVSAILAILTSIVYIAWFMKAYPEAGTLQETLFYAVRVLNGWSLLLCIFYLADRYLSFSNRFLHYAGEASMPFYVLHQPVILLIGFMIKDWPIAIPIKLAILVVAAFAVIWLCCHFIIQRIPLLRLLFGMKGKQPAAQTKVFSVYMQQ